MRKRLATALFLFAILLYISGCGSGGSSGGSGTSSTDGGIIQLRVSYPQDQADSLGQKPEIYIQYYIIDLYKDISTASPSSEKEDITKEEPVQSLRIDYPDDTATFSSLDYGSYRVEVRGFNNENILVTAGTGYGTVTTDSSPDVVVTTTPVGSPTPSPTASVSPSPTVSPTESPSPSPSPTVSPSPSPSPLPDEIRTVLCSPPRMAENSSRQGSVYPTVSDDGNIVVFRSLQQLVSDHTNPYVQIYMFNVGTGTIKLISREPGGLIGDNNSGGSNAVTFPVVSGNGEYVVFQSEATNLLGSGMDNNGKIDVFIYDITNDEMGRVSVKFGSPTVGGNEHSKACSISADGKYVAFDSGATDLVQSPTTAGIANVYRATMEGKGSAKPLAVQRIELVSNDYSAATVYPADKDSTEPWISRDGRFIAYQSFATNLIATPSLDGVASQVFLVDMNNTYNTRTRLVSISNSNSAADTGAKLGHVSDDGSRVVFESDAQNLGSPNIGIPEIYMWDRLNGLKLISKPNGGAVGNSRCPTISGDGRYVAFMSYATGFVDNDNNGSPDCFVYDTETNKFVMVSVNSAGVQAESSSGSSYPFINKDGKIVVFMSHAKNLADNWPAQTSSSVADVFLRQWFK